MGTRQLCPPCFTHCSEFWHSRAFHRGALSCFTHALPVLACDWSRWYDDLLPNTVVVASDADSACSALPKPAPHRSQGAPGAVWELLMYHKSTYGHNMDAVVGPACSGASNAAAYFADEFQVPMVSYSATSKSLSGRSPFFFRLSVSDNIKSKIILDFLLNAGWKCATSRFVLPNSLGVPSFDCFVLWRVAALV